MTINLALEYIPRRMKELGYEDYTIRFRHWVVHQNEVIEIDGINHIYLLIEPPETVTVESDFGLFDMSNNNINEYQYEHQGTIIISSYAAEVQHIRMIQVIPKPLNQCL
jgi:hypothetical protein